MADNPVAILHRLRKASGPKETVGLSDHVIEDFCNSDADLVQAIHEAEQVHRALMEEFGEDVMSLPEPELIKHLQSDYVNFYSAATVNPYIPIAGRGPWLVTVCGSVLHD
ncbi:MAG TPA: lysine 6-aminotransferase, partial [Candidatus Poseidoniales archaeon]